MSSKRQHLDAPARKLEGDLSLSASPATQQGPGVWLLLVLYGITATGWAWLNPVFEAPDEPFHVASVNLMVREHRRANPAEIRTTAQFMRAVGPEEDFRVFEAGQWKLFVQWSQPPFYYMLQAIPLALVYPGGFSRPLVSARPDYRHHRERGYFRHDRAEPWTWSRELVAIRLMRMVSVALGGVAIWLTAQIARLVAPSSASLPLLAAGVYAFIPQFTFMTATVNNDALGYLVGAVALWLMVRVVQASWPPGRAALLIGLILGVGLLSKWTTLFLWPLTLVVVCLAYRRWADRAVSAVGAMAVGLGILGSVGYLFAERTGPALDLLAFSLTGRPSSWLTLSSPFLGNPPERTVGYLGKVLGSFAESFWGQFGWEQVRIDPGALGAYWLLVGLAVAGWWWGRPHRVAGRVDRQAMRVLGGAIVAFLVSLGVLYSHVFIPQGGRYLLTVGCAIAVFLGIGLLGARGLLVKVLERQIPERRFTWGLVACLVGLNWAVLYGCVYRAYVVAWGVADGTAGL